MSSEEAQADSKDPKGEDMSLIKASKRHQMSNSESEVRRGKRHKKPPD